MYRSARNRHWVVLVWITVAFFIFPLTPPISQHLPYEDSALGQVNHTHTTYMHIESVPSKKAVNPYKSLLTLIETGHEKSYYLSLLILFLLFLHSKVPEILKRNMLAPLKFTSVYVVGPHSITHSI